MFQLFVLYDHPADPAAFDIHYESTHIPLVREIPGLRGYTVARPGPAPDGNRPAWHLVATLEFDDEAAFAAGMGSPAGQAAVTDLGTFARDGVTMLPADGVTKVR